MKSCEKSEKNIRYLNINLFPCRLNLNRSDIKHIFLSKNQLINIYLYIISFTI